MNTKDSLNLFINHHANGHIRDVIRFLVHMLYLLIVILLDRNFISDKDVEWIMKEIK